MQKLPKGKHITRENARTIMEDEYNFTISDVPAKVIETDSVVSYTLLIKRDTSSSNTFENLVINVKNDDLPSAHILKYIPTSDITPTIHNSYSFSANLELESVVYNFSESLSKKTIVCITVQEFMCNYGGEEHAAGENCTAANTYWQETTTCYSIGGGSGGIGDSGNPGQPGGGGGGDSDDGNNPNNPPAGEEGDEHGQPEAPPLITSPVVDETPPKDPCETLTSKTNEPTFREKLSQMNLPQNFSLNHETGFAESATNPEILFILTFPPIQLVHFLYHVV